MFRSVSVALVLVGLITSWAIADDWPTYQHDHRRSGVTEDKLSLPLSQAWQVDSPTAPLPAWSPPQLGWTEHPKLDFDTAFFTVADRDSVYFSSSVENQVVAIEASTGRQRWQFFTSSPVRIAPSLSAGRVYFGADDGQVYCVQAKTGELVWKFNAAPDERRVIGNGRITSLWPVRTDVLIEGDTAYCCSGVFPYHKVWVRALHAETGQELWKNSDFKNYGGFSPQGYLLSGKAGLIVPAGRASPVCLSRKDGTVLFDSEHVGDKGATSGVHAAIYDDVMYVGTQGILYGIDTATGKGRGAFPTSARVIVETDRLYLLKSPPAPAYGRRSISTAKNEVTCIDRATYRALERKDEKSVAAAARWRFVRPHAKAMIRAGSHLVVGGQDEVLVLDVDSGKVAWQSKVNGLACGLTVAHGRLLVSTDRGSVHCFASGVPSVQLTKPLAVFEPDKLTQQRVEDIRALTPELKSIQGYGLLSGDDCVPLAIALARQCDLQLTCVLPDEASVTRARQLVSAIGLYGWRITVEKGQPELLPYPDYAANLIVTLPSQSPVAEAELWRIQKPCGGIRIDARRELDQGASTEAAQRWKKHVRGELKGSGWWTQQYADAGNSGSSRDRLIKGSLDVLWFGEPGPDEFPDRHQRGVAPVVHNGRAYCQGWNFLDRQVTLFCFDIYNGVRYWKRDVEGEIRIGLPAVAGNLACDDRSAFMAAGSKCQRYDPDTGAMLATYETPPREDGSHPKWGSLTVAEGLVIGSSSIEPAQANPNPNQPSFSDAVFAYEIATGRLLWNYRAKSVRDTTISLGKGRVFFAEKRQADAKEAVPKSRIKELLPPDETSSPVLIRTIVALEASSGHLAWARDVDLTDCGRWENSLWGSIQALCDGDVLIFAGAYTIYPSKAPPRPHRGLALSTRDGTELWSTELGNRSRPVMMHDALLAEPLFFQLQTGKPVLREPNKSGKQIPLSSGSRTGGCGSLSASDCMVFGRGGYTIWKDVINGGTSAFIGTRPGCFINIIPAGGVVLQAEASSGCACYHAVQTTVVFKPRTPF